MKDYEDVRVKFPDYTQEWDDFFVPGKLYRRRGRRLGTRIFRENILLYLYVDLDNALVFLRGDGTKGYSYQDVTFKPSTVWERLL